MAIQNKAFTLVELIIVITILAILATIGFMSFQSYTLDARDSSRITSLKELSNGLQIYETKKAILPHPDEQVTTISSGTSIISYQGYAGATVLQKLKASDIKDPKDNNYYTYIVNSDKTKYQLLSLLENGTSINTTSYNKLVNTTYATNSYTDRFMYTVGDKVGIFLDNTTKSPVQETLTGINLQTNNTNFKVVFANTTSNSGVIVGSGVSLATQVLTISNTVAIAQTTTPVIRGEQSYTTPGTYSWTAPAGVNSVSVVCVGGGGGSSYSKGGGGGGGLGYKNNISVVSGIQYQIIIGSGGISGTSLNNDAKSGGNSSFNASMCVGYGGTASVSSPGSGGFYIGDGGGNGGNGGSSTAESGGGGGAGGYIGNGGNGGKGTASMGGDGGGVGIFGLGINGSGGLAGGTNEYWSGGFAGSDGLGGGGGGGGGGNAGSGYNGSPGSGGNGRIYGGGSGKYYNTNFGGNGACRIVYPGTSRQFPSTDVGL